MTLLSQRPQALIGAKQPAASTACIIENQLYFTSFDTTPRDNHQNVYFCVDDYVHYDAFYDDFGPLNLAVLYRFCESLNAVLEAEVNKKRNIFIVATSCSRSRVNTAYLVAAYMVIYHNLTADQAYLRVQAIEPPKLIEFRDAAMGQPSYLLHVHDVIKSIEKALQLKWLNFFDGSFDPDEYEFYERVENGDFNWIIPGKVLSFCGPHDRSYNENGYPYHAPDVYFDYFRKTNVTSIVRLNRKVYDAKRFVDAGFEHHDLFFIDGSTPSDEIVLKFMDVVDKAPGAVAVHCKAGLGRTGTLIACWMMKNFRLTAAQCMGWLRICRPGSVIGPQQQFLVDKQAWCWKLGKKILGGPIASKLVNRQEETPPPATVKSKDGNKSKVKSKILLNHLANELDDIGLCDMKSGGASAVSGSYIICSSSEVDKSTQPVKSYSLRSRPSNSSISDSNDSETADETAINAKGQSQGDRLCEMKAKAQHNKVTAQREDKRRPDINPWLVRAIITNSPSASTAAKSVPSKYSSATTPIKQLRLSNSRVLDSSNQCFPKLKNFTTKPTTYQSSVGRVPISKVTVSCRPSILRNNVNKKLFTTRNSKPYSSSLARIDLNKTANNNYSSGTHHSSTCAYADRSTDNYNNNTSSYNNYSARSTAFNPPTSLSRKYELRPRNNLHLPSRFDPAITLSPRAFLSSPIASSGATPTSVSTRL